MLVLLVLLVLLVVVFTFGEVVAVRGSASSLLMIATLLQVTAAVAVEVVVFRVFENSLC